MTYVGIILALAGFGVYGLLYLGNAPAFITGLPLPAWGWIAVGGVGLLTVMLNRRPGD